VTDEVSQTMLSLTHSQKQALLRTNGRELSDKQTARAVLAGRLTDYSYRPAKLTRLGISVYNFLKDQHK
jgi:hypothetical protein